jgi:hypothetical protein
MPGSRPGAPAGSATRSWKSADRASSFTVPGVSTPRLRLTSEIQVRLISSADGALLHSLRLRRVGGEKSFEEWVGKDGSAVAAELGDSEAFAERILDELFLLVELPEGAPR